MLMIRRNRQQCFWDQMSRRSFEKIGAVGLGSLVTGGFNLSDMFYADALSNPTSSHKSVIMVYLPGGLTQHEAFGPKPQGRKKFAERKTRSAQGFLVSSCANCCVNWLGYTDRFSVVRTLIEIKTGTSRFTATRVVWVEETKTSRPREDGRHIRLVISRVSGPTEPGLLAYVDTSPKMKYGRTTTRGYTTKRNGDHGLGLPKPNTFRCFCR